MNFVKFVVVCAGALLLTGSAFGQFASQVKVSNAVEESFFGVSTARCGNNIVVGFGDAESGQTDSFEGFAYSLDGGKTFTDGGTLPVPPPGPQAIGSNRLGEGNPSVACSSSSHFYYASDYLSSDPICRGFQSCPAITVSTSTNGGKTWGLPVVVATGPGDTHDLLSPSLAVDPTRLSRLYVAYLDNNFAGPVDFGFDDCSGTPSVIELRMGISTDGGKTWTTNVVDHACGISTDQEHQGLLATPNVLVSPGGKVYLTYEFHPQGSPVPVPNEIRFTRSLDAGTSFSPPITVSKDAIDNGLPQLGVDRTVSRHRGEIYLTWSGAPTGTYTDVLVSDSVNFGVSFSFPRPISPAPAAGTGRFQTNPVITVDSDGQVVDCYYSTPSNKPASSSTYSYNCAESFNHAASWVSQRLANSAPVGFDAVTSDFLLHNDGFFTAFELQSSGHRYVFGEKSDNR
jgi:hypothetical protein